MKGPSKKDVDEWINAIFMPIPFEEPNQKYIDTAITGFENLTYFFINRIFKQTKNSKAYLKNVRFDYVALASTLKRFQRDAFGVNRFETFLKSMVDSESIKQETAQEILSEVCSLGLRVTAESPRKTRVPAVFSFWMCVLRPVSFNLRRVPKQDIESLETFCAALNFFIASSYLHKFGDTNLGATTQEESVRVKRVLHDFTYREVGLSTLETFYSSILQIFPHFSEHENTKASTFSSNLQ